MPLGIVHPFEEVNKKKSVFMKGIRYIVLK